MVRVGCVQPHGHAAAAAHGIKAPTERRVAAQEADDAAPQLVTPPLPTAQGLGDQQTTKDLTVAEALGVAALRQLPAEASYHDRDGEITGSARLIRLKHC